MGHCVVLLLVETFNDVQPKIVAKRDKILMRDCQIDKACRNQRTMWEQMMAYWTACPPWNCFYLAILHTKTAHYHYGMVFPAYWLSNLYPNHDDLPFPLSLRAKVLNSGSLWFFYAIWCGYGHHFLLAISAMFCKMLQFRPRFRLNLVCNVVACRAQIIFRPLLILKINKVVINYRIKNNRLAIFLL